MYFYSILFHFISYFLMSFYIIYLYFIHLFIHSLSFFIFTHSFIYSMCYLDFFSNFFLRTCEVNLQCILLRQKIRKSFNFDLHHYFFKSNSQVPRKFSINNFGDETHRSKTTECIGNTNFQIALNDDEFFRGEFQLLM